MKRPTRRTFGLAVLLQPAVLALAIHQHKLGGVPQLVAEIAIALAALGVEVDVAAQAGITGHGEAQGVGTKCRDARRELFGRVFAHLRRGLWLAQADDTLVQQRRQLDAINEVHRVQHIAFALAHFLALCIAHQAVDVDVLEGHGAGRVLGCGREVRGHHDHPGDPEKDDVKTRDQHGGGQEQVLLNGLLRPAQSREGHQGTGVPSVQHVFIADQFTRVA